MAHWGVETLCEPFAGGLAVSFGLEFPRVLAADTNRGLINFYQYVKSGGVISAPNPPVVDRDRYNRVRDRYNNNPWSPVELGPDRDKAVQFLFLNKYGYSGLYRVNKLGRYNVPWSQNPNPSGGYPNLAPYKQLMSGWLFSYSAWEQTLDIAREYDEKTVLVFADPPYDGTFDKYGFWGGLEEQQRLANRLMVHRGPVVATNAATDAMVEIYTKRGFTITYRTTASSVGRARGSATTQREMIAYRGPIE